MPRGFSLLLVSLFVLCVGCGGGGGNSGSGNHGGGGDTPPPIPTLASIAPSNASAGTLSLTLAVYGSNFDQSSVVRWNGIDLLTYWGSPTTLTAIVPTANLVTTGSAQVSVRNSSGSSASKTFTISTAPAPVTWVRTVAGITDPNQMVYDSVRGKIYVSMPSTDLSAPNTIIPVDPVAGTAGAPVIAGNGPNLMSISSDGAYLWVGLDGDGAVQRFSLPGLDKDITVPVPLALDGGQQQAISFQAAPVNPHAMAMVAGRFHTSSPGNGVYVFDDAVQRANFVPGWMPPGDGPSVNWIQWGANDSVIYGMQGGFFTLNVDAQGVTWTQPAQASLLSPGTGQYDKTTGLLYFADWAYDPERNMQVGIYGGGGQGGINLSGGCGAAAVNPSLGRRYCILSSTHSNPELLVFDQDSYAFIRAIDLGTTITGNPQTLIPWGNAGLALLTKSTWPDTGNGGIFLIDGSAVNPNASPDVASGSPTSPPFISLASVSPQEAAAGSPDLALTVTGSGFTQNSVVYSNYGYLNALPLPTTYVSATQLTATLPAAAMSAVAPVIITVFDGSARGVSTNSMVFTVYSNSGNTQVTGVNLSGLSLVWNPANSILYVGTSMFDAAHPNSIVAIDPTNAAITDSVQVSPEPIFVDIASDHSRLFVAYAEAEAMSELKLPDLNLPVTWPLLDPQGGGPYFAGDMKAAPDSPATTAVTLIDRNVFPSAAGGVEIFDDNVPRSVFAPGWVEPGNPGALYDTLAWSNSNTTLAAANNESDDIDGLLSLYTLNVNVSGVSYGETYNGFNATGAEIHSDFSTGLIYSDDGVVANPFDGSIRGSFGASGLVLPDPSTQLVYIIGQTRAQEGTYSYTIQSYNKSTFALVGSITLPRLIGIPFRMVRWGTSGLAILVYNSWPDVDAGPETMLYLVKDPSFISSAQSVGYEPSRNERVQARWKRLTPRHISSRIDKATPGSISR